MTALPNSPHDGPDVRSEQASPAGPATSNKAGTDAQAGSLQAPEGSRSMPRWRKSLLGGSMAAATIGLLAAGLVFWANGQSRPDRNAAQTVADAAVHTRRPGEPVKSGASAGSTTPP